MSAVAIGLLAGVLLGIVYLIGAKRQVRRTLASSILLGIFVGVLVELARRPLFAAVFAGMAMIFLVEFIRWVMGSLRQKQE